MCGRRFKEVRINQLLQEVDEFKQLLICVGNDDDIYKHLDISNSKAAQRENGNVRSTNCTRVATSTKGSRCQPCQQVRAYLRKKTSRHNHYTANIDSRTDPSSSTKLTHLTTAELQLRLQKTTELSSKLKIELKTLTEKYNAVEVNETLHNLVRETANTNVTSLPENSLSRLFIQQQIEYHEGGRHAMAWHPTMIRWALTVHAKSAAAYSMMRDSGLVVLPSERTLDNYKHYREYNAGVDYDIIEQHSKSHSNQDFSLLMDEMRIKQGLVYSIDGKLSGYVSLSISNGNFLSSDFKEDLASHALVLMARGIQDKTVTFAASTYFTKSASAHDMFFMLWETVAAMELCQLKVRILVSDGAAANRLLIKMHAPQSSQNEVTYRTVNRFAPTRWFYFASDVPHLMKTSRNCTELSGGHLNTRNLVVRENSTSIGINIQK